MTSIGQANLSKHHLGSAPKAFQGHSAAICGRIAALLGLVCRIEQHKSQSRPRQCAQLFLFEHPRTHLSTTSNPTCVECASSGQRPHQNSATQLSRAYPTKLMRLCDRRAVALCGIVGGDWNNARPARPTAVFGTPVRFQIFAPRRL